MPDQYMSRGVVTYRLWAADSQDDPELKIMGGFRSPRIRGPFLQVRGDTFVRVEKRHLGNCRLTG